MSAACKLFFIDRLRVKFLQLYNANDFAPVLANNTYYRKPRMLTEHEISKDIEAKVKAFFEKHRRHEYLKGDIVIQAHEAYPGIFYLITGYVRMFTISKVGEELTMHIFKPHTYFPLSLALKSGKNPYYFEAMTDVSVFMAPKEEVFDFLKSNPEVMFSLTSRFASALEGFSTRLQHLMFGNALSKTASLLTYLTKFFGKPVPGGTMLDFPLTHEHLASWAGMTRVSISQAIGKLKKQGLIRYDKNHIVIPDIPKLAESAAV